jgi:tetratricopeptide (TPR) repeat protein
MPPLPSFGDYELVRELGKGGMGIVYEARQISLDRTVALKMMLAGAFASEEELRRFRNEAEAVAQLDHPNIVPILDVGRLDEHRYFTMRLVRGGSLAERLGKFVGDPKGAARIVATVAEALHHAHLRGFLHRDLKPANILIDERGEPHITDFGLARRVGSESDSQLTQTGTILGTPGYIAPEQATGRRGSVTVAADVYGLGAVLYALLTGRPPFAGDSPLDTLKQVCERAPELPSRIESRVPRDLETICLKCLEKEPGRRYANALALAEDLRRWIAGEPIAARPVGRAVRLAMWCRRKPALAALAGFSLAACIAGIVGVVWQWRRAEANLVTARDRFDLAMQAVDAYTSGASEDVLLKEPRLDGLRRRLLSGSLEFYRRLGNSLAGAQDRPSRVALGRALAQIGDLTAKIGSKPQALAAHREALAIREALANEVPHDLETRIDRAHSQLDVGLLEYEVGRHGEAMISFRSSLELLDGLGREQPGRTEVQLDLARAHNAIASELFRDRKIDAALTSFARSRAIRERLVGSEPRNSRYRDELAKAYGNIGVLLRNAGRHTEALEAFTKALEQFEALERDNRDDPARTASVRADEVGALLNIAGGRTQLDTTANVDATYERALSIAEALVRDHPTDSRSLGTLAQACHALGEHLGRAGHTADARVAFARAARVLEGLARDNPSVQAYRSDLVRSRFLLGQALGRLGQADEAIEAYKAARETLAALSREDPAVSEYHADLATIDHALVQGVEKTGQRDTILAAYAREADSLRHLIGAHSTEARYRLSLAENRRAAGLLFRRLGRVSEAIGAFAETGDAASGVARQRPEEVRARFLWGWSHNARGEDLRTAGRMAEARDAYQKAEAVLGPLARDHPNEAIVFEWAAVLANLGLVRRVLVAPAAGAADLARAVAVLEPLARAHPEHRAYQSDLAAMYKELAIAERAAGRPRAAAAALRRAIAVLEGLGGTSRGELQELRTLISDVAFPADPFAR